MAEHFDKYYCNNCDNDNLNDYADYLYANTPPYSVNNSSPPQHNEHHQHDDPSRDDYYSYDAPHYHDKHGKAVHYYVNIVTDDDLNCHNAYLDRVGDDGVDQWEGYRSELSEE